MSNSRRTERGFSIVELMIVCVVVLVVVAFALPNVWNTLETFRLRTRVGDLATMLQRARSEAVKRNSPAGVGLSGSQFWVDTNANSSMDANENARLLLPPGITVESSDMPASLEAAALGNASGATITVAGSSSPVYFNARGLPCPYDSSTKTCNASISGSAYVYYFQDTRLLGSSGWAAVSVSPAGRVKVWKWNGSEWK